MHVHMHSEGQSLKLSVQICTAEGMFARALANGQAPASGLASPAGLRPPMKSAMKKDAKVGPPPCTQTRSNTAKIALDTD